MYVATLVWTIILIETMGGYFVVLVTVLISSSALVHATYDHSSWELSRRYDHELQLDDDGRFKMFYSYDLDDKTIMIAVQVQTTGWIGFGFTPNGGMTGSDVEIGWVDKFGYAFLQV